MVNSHRSRVRRITVVEELDDWPAGPPASAGIPCWPPNWVYIAKQPKRTLAWAAGGHVRIEVLADSQQELTYSNVVELADIAHNATPDGLIVYMPDSEFESWLPDWLRELPPGSCVWSDSAEKVVAIKMRQGRRIRYVYRASCWLNLDVFGLERLREFLDYWQLGDRATPGALGAATMAAAFPRGKKLYRPPWQAWHDLHENLTAGRTELLYGWHGSKAVEVDINNAYAAAISSGVPAGYCCKLFCEEDVKEFAWTYGHYRWSIPDGAELEYGVLGVRSKGHARTKLHWPREAGTNGEGWYTGAEIRAARDAGYLCQLVKGWGWSEVSTDFAQWAEWLDAVKAAYKDDGAELEVGWVKQLTVAAIGRLGMNALETQTWQPDTYFAAKDRPASEIARERYEVVEGRAGVAVVLTQKHCLPSRADLLIQVAVHVHASVRETMRVAYQALRDAGCKPNMANIDCWYVPQRSKLPAWALPSMTFGHRLGEWKQKPLTGLDITDTIEIEKPGWVLAGNLHKTPGVPKT